MTAALLDLDAVATALLDQANAFLAGKGAQASVLDSFPTDGAAMPYAVQYMLGLGERLPTMGAETLWPQQVQYTSVGLAPAQARRLGQLLDEFVAGEDVDGGYLHPLDLSATGVAATRRESNRDAHGDMSGILHTWACTYTLDLQLL